MDIKTLFSHSSFQLHTVSKKTSPTLNCDADANLSSQTDALEAVKLDPAVLEAQVTVLDKRDNAKCKESSGRQSDVFDTTKDNQTPPVQNTRKGFKEMVSQHEEALLSLSPHQLEMLMKYADMLRRQRIISQRYSECAFCKNNGRPASWYTSHVLKDGRGHVQCPVLRRYRCPLCSATGSYAHTIKYCPDNSLLDTLSNCSSNLF